MGRKIEMPSKQELEAAYSLNPSGEFLAQKYNCKKSTIYNWLKAYGIKTISMKGRKLSVEHREKVVKTLASCPMKGKKHSDETKKKMSIDRTGEKNSNYKGGVTAKIRKFRRTKEYIAWRNAVISRANGRCEKCGEKAKLEAHHKISLHKDFSKALDIDNGSALCSDCHKEEDKKGEKPNA